MVLYCLIVCIIATAVMVNGVHSFPHINSSYGGSSQSTVVLVNSSIQLEGALNCIAGDDEVKEVEIVLDHQTKSYELYWEDFIYFTEKDITIRSSSAEERVTLDCNCSGSVSNGGLAFVNSSVTLLNLHFVSCGANLSQLPHTIVDMLLKMDSTFPENNATILIISSKLNLTGVYIEASKGFAFSAINLLTTSSFEHMKIYNSNKISKKYVMRKSRRKIGGGVFLFFSDDSPASPTENTTVSLKEVVFMKNINMYRRIAQFCKRNYVTPDIAPGLTIKYAQKTYFVHVTIDRAHFHDNVGQYNGAILIINHEEVWASTVIRNSVFEKNGITKCFGKDLVLLHRGGKLPDVHWERHYPLVIDNSSFVGGFRMPNPSTEQIISISAIAIGVYASDIPMIFSFKNLQFSQQSTPGFDGTCIRFERLFRNLPNIKKPGDINVTMENINATKNAIKIQHRNKSLVSKSLFYFHQVTNVTFMGDGVFEDNYGSVIHADGTNVYLTGNMTFRNNTANVGAAIYIHGNALLYFMPGLQHASFINNRAYYSGGAIHAKCTIYNARSKCALQINSSSHVKTKFIFKNNVATVAGNSIFATPISNCKIEMIYKTHQWLPKYLKYFNLSNEYDTNNTYRLPLSTTPYALFVRYKDLSNNYVPENRTLQKFPGEKFSFCMLARDSNGRGVFSYMSLEIFHVDNTETNGRFWVHQSAGGNVIMEQKYTTNTTIMIHTSLSDHRKTITMKLVVSIPDYMAKYTVETYYIDLKPCPLGFNIDQSFGICHCSQLLKQYLPDTSCQISYRTIKRPKDLNTWIGVDQNTEALSPYCPYLYCDTNPQYKFLKSTDHGFLLSNVSGLNSIPICMNNRTGVLCGRCDTSNNYSLVFGSSECKLCSNLWLITIIGYSIIGPLLVYILYALRLTITVGTLNGAIFYVQAANAGLIEYMTTPYTETILNTINHVYRSIFLFLNLNLGIPLCFYNGMDQLWKTGLGLVFPVYLLLIVVCVIIISRYSTWVSNRTAHLSVQVLVTVVHLSFSKLLETLIEVFTAATVYTANPGNSSHLVWYWDGSIKYLGTSHLLLTAITTTIVSLLLIPYIGLLAFGRRIMKCSKRANLYLRPVIETAYAPYKEGKQHWFVLRLILLIVIYILYVLGTKTILNISMMATLASFTVMKAFSRPYKNNAITVLDCWLMVNIIIVYTTLWSPTQSTATLVFNTILVSLGLLTIGGILLYHILQVTKYRNIITNNLLMKGKKYIPLVRRHNHQHGSDPAGRPIGQQGNNGSRGIGRGYRQFTDSSCKHVYREPLITEVYCDPTAVNNNNSD